MTPVICTIYRSPKKDGLYLYTKKDFNVGTLPEALRKTFGKPEHAMNLILGTGRKLVRVDTDQVLAALDDKGFFIQFPPPEGEDIMQAFKDGTA